MNNHLTLKIIQSGFFYVCLQKLVAKKKNKKSDKNIEKLDFKSVKVLSLEL